MVSTFSSINIYYAQSRSGCRLVGRGVLVSRSHISFYLRTGEGGLDDMCSSTYRQAWGILLRNVIDYYYYYSSSFNYY